MAEDEGASQSNPKRLGPGIHVEEQRILLHRASLLDLPKPDEMLPTLPKALFEKEGTGRKSSGARQVRAALGFS